MSVVRRGTWVMLGVAAMAVGLARNDPWAQQRAVAPLTSNHSAAWRLLPALGEVDVASASIELQPPVGPAVRLVAAVRRGGHELWEGDRFLGPADPDAVEGLWSSLRMARTVRAVVEDSDVALGAGGTISLSWPGHQRTLTLGEATADEAGVYGALQGGAVGTEGTWVVENELSILLSQAPRAWLARRAMVVQASHVESIAFAQGGAAQRGADALWRTDSAILEPHTVQTRIERVVSARLDPLVPQSQLEAVEAWLVLRDITGVETTLSLAGPCPGRPDRVVLVRGPGLAGCIDAHLVEPWPWPALLHPSLAPHEYGAVLSIEQRLPQARTMARHGGGWRLQERIDGRPTVTDVDEPEVFRWYGALHDAEVELASTLEPPSQPPQTRFSITTEHGVAMTLACWAAEADGLRRCRRDGGPMLRVRSKLGPLVLSPALFSDRRLVTRLSVDDVRAVEILAGDALPDGEGTRRQSAHFDLGVWRMDAPSHPESDDAMDGTKLEALLAAVAGLRADAWVAPPNTAPLRTVRVEQVARSGVSDTVAVALHEGCVVVVDGRRPATVSESACRRLSADLLFNDPLAAWLDRALAVELTGADGEVVPLQRVGAVWARGDGLELGPLAQTLAAMSRWRADAVLTGEPTGAPLWTLRVRLHRGPAFNVQVGPHWAQIEGADWWYRGPAML